MSVLENSFYKGDISIIKVSAEESIPYIVRGVSVKKMILSKKAILLNDRLKKMCPSKKVVLARDVTVERVFTVVS